MASILRRRLAPAAKFSTRSTSYNFYPLLPNFVTTETILGVRFFNGTVDEAVELMSTNGGLLVVPAAPALVKVRSDEGYRRALLSSDMVIADSGAMVLLWKILTGRKVERISGLKFL